MRENVDARKRVPPEGLAAASPGSAATGSLQVIQSPRAQVDRSAYEPSLSNGRHHGIPPSIKSNEMR